ncbi:MAG: hypothetical protein COB39_07830 [Marinosulfonomonas sp.]|nr:MAG: hypothetical protein COB39_07830 [Marinosulfonomonas sp.]
MFRFVLLFLLAALPLKAEEIVADLSQSSVGISATFDGSNILIFGAISRDAPAPTSEPLQVIISVAGPSKPVTVRLKEKKVGIWVNSDSVLIDEAPSFYSVATTAPLIEILTDDEDRFHKVSIDRAINSMSAQIQSSGHARDFVEALIRIRTDNGLYQVHEGAVELMSDTLFRTSIDLPSNLTAGEYTARILITRDQRVVDMFETKLDIQKVGIERWLYNLAHDNAVYYGLMSLFIAIAAGWLASAVFSYFRP